MAHFVSSSYYILFDIILCYSILFYIIIYKYVWLNRRNGRWPLPLGVAYGPNRHARIRTTTETAQNKWHSMSVWITGLKMPYVCLDLLADTMSLAVRLGSAIRIGTIHLVHWLVFLF
jgi:hypothetical protein